MNYESSLAEAMHRFEMEPALLVVREIIPQTYSERVLLAAIIRRAAYDLALYKGDRRTPAKNLYLQAREWIFSDDETMQEGTYTADTDGRQLRLFDQFMTFRNLCWLLNQNPIQLRQKILKLKKKDVRQYDMFDGHSTNRV